MKKLLAPVGVIIGLVIILAIMIMPKYNSFVHLDEDVNEKESQIETQLQRRGDLIPNLVNTVKGYASHEKEVFTDIADARSQLAGANGVEELSDANDQMTGALSRLLAISEDYPELQASEQFTGLRDELAGAENRISVARQDYNESVQQYNKETRTFPGNIIASVFNFEKKPYFEADSNAKNVPDVEFNTNQEDNNNTGDE